MHRIFFPLAALLFAAAPLRAQTPIAVGQAGFGELADTDPRTGGGMLYDAWSFTPVEGRTYRITLRSADFEPYLRAGPRDGDECRPCTDEEAGNDDAWDAELVFTARAGSPHLILASGWRQGASGLYTLTVQEAAPLDYSEPVGSTVIPTGAALRRLSPNAIHDDTLQAGDYVDEDGELMDVFTYAGTEGAYVFFEMAASDFDEPRVRVGTREGGTWRELKPTPAPSVEHGIRVRFPRSGEYEVRVRGSREGTSGAYAISTFPVFSDRDSVAEPGSIAPGQVRQGMLDGSEERDPDGNPVENWEIAGGRTVTIDLRSGWFDPVLRVLAQQEDGSWRVIARDDDGGVYDDSRVIIHLPLPGRYRVQVTSIYETSSGPYTLQVREGIY